jgi:Zn-dependent alcohol dehydrogenase
VSCFEGKHGGISSSDWKKRQGLMDRELPQTMGHEAADVVDELGEGVTDVATGETATRGLPPALCGRSGDRVIRGEYSRG